MKNNEKKLLFVINHYSVQSDQHLFHVLNLVREIAKNGVEIALVIERCEGEPPELGENVTVYAQRQKNKAGRLIELFGIVGRLVKRGYNKIFVRISLHAAMVSVLCAKLFQGETFFWHSGSGFELMGEMPKARRKEMERGRRKLWFIGRSIDHFVTGPETMVAYYEKWCGIPKEKMTLLYNDVDIERFCPASVEEKKMLRRELGLKEDQKYILFVHRFSPIRKTAYYIPYCLQKADLKDVVYLLVGSGPEERDVRRLVTESGIDNVVFLGSQPNQMIQKYYKACDVFFNPSYCEGFPRVIIEAMACGMPIVTTNAGGISDILSGIQQKYIADVSDRDRLSDMLRDMIGRADDREACREENLERIRRYSTENVAQMYIDTFWKDI